MLRITFKDIERQVENINIFCLQGNKHKISARRMNGQIYLYQVKNDESETWVRFMFGGSARECYHYLFGWTEMYYNWK